MVAAAGHRRSEELEEHIQELHQEHLTAERPAVDNTDSMLRNFDSRRKQHMGLDRHSTEHIAQHSLSGC